MRIAATMTVVLSLTAAAQPPAPPPNPAPRYGVLYNERFFPQVSPKVALSSVVKAADLGQFDYIAAYLMDEKAADAAVAARAKELYPAAEKDLLAEREKQRADPFRPAPANPLPLEPNAFALRVQTEATRRGFEQLVREIRERFAEDPSHFLDLQRYLREGTFNDTDGAADVTLKADKARALHLKKVGNRWFLEDRMNVAPAAPPPAKDN